MRLFYLKKLKPDYQIPLMMSMEIIYLISFIIIFSCLNNNQLIFTNNTFEHYYNSCGLAHPLLFRFDTVL